MRLLRISPPFRERVLRRPTGAGFQVTLNASARGWSLNCTKRFGGRGAGSSMKEAGHDAIVIPRGWQIIDPV